MNNDIKVGLGRRLGKLWAQSFTSLKADLLSRHKWRFLHLAGALMEHFLEESAPLTQKRRFVFVTLLIWINVSKF